jgi:hypothetical protein
MTINTAACARLITAWSKRRKAATGMEPNANATWERINKLWGWASEEDREEIFYTVRPEALPRFIKQEQPQ